MPPPSNTSPATATDIAALPFITTQQVDDAGTTFTVWYKRTAPAGTLEMGLHAYEVAGPDIYDPTVTVYSDAGVTPWLNIVSTEQPIQHPTVAGTTYYYEIAPQGGNPAPALLTVEAYAAPQQAVQPSDILVNDDTAGFPGAVVQPDGTIRNFVYPFAAGEAGDVLDTGEVLLNHATTEHLRFYTSQLVQVASIFIDTSSPSIRTSQGLQQFFVMSRVSPSPAVVTAYNATGGVLSTETLTGITSFLGFAPNNDGSRYYWSNNAVASPIRVWDPSINAELANLTAGVAGRWIADILVLGDGTIVASYTQIVLGTLDVRRYSAAGALLNTYSIGTTLLPAGTFPRLAFGVDDPNEFWVWWHPSTALSRYQRIRVSDGTVLETRNVIEFEGGVNQLPGDTSDFGVSFSCPFLLLRAAINATNSDSSLIVSGGGGGGSTDGCPAVMNPGPGGTGACRVQMGVT